MPFACPPLVAIGRPTVTSLSARVHAEPSMRGYEIFRDASSDASTFRNSSLTSATLLCFGIA
jgi:hypothetical protein